MILLDVAIFRLNCCDAMVPTQQKLLLDENFALLLVDHQKLFGFLLFPIYFVYKVLRNPCQNRHWQEGDSYLDNPSFYIVHLYSDMDTVGF